MTQFSSVGRWYSPISGSVNTLLWMERSGEEVVAILVSPYYRP